MNLVEEVKRKREFSGLPDSVVGRALDKCGGDVKEARALLRKYFGVFLTNRVLGGRLGADEMLAAHMSSRKRNYEKFYGEIFSEIGEVGSVVDLGCGVNGFSYKYLPRGIDYVGVEAVGQLVEQANDYFKIEGFDARVVKMDLFDVDSVLKVLGGAKRPRVVFMFQVVDALENLKKDFSKEFILKISEECEAIVLSLSMESLGGRKKFVVQRKWIMDFLEKNFIVEKRFAIGGEKIVMLKNKK